MKVGVIRVLWVVEFWVFNRGWDILVVGGGIVFVCWMRDLNGVDEDKVERRDINGRRLLRSLKGIKCRELKEGIFFY